MAPSRVLQVCDTVATHARQQLRLHSSTPSTCSMKFLREILEDIVGATSVPPWSTGTCDFEGLFSFLIPSVDSVCMHDGCTQPTRMWRNLLGLHLLLGDTYSREIECFRQWSFANVFRFFCFYRLKNLNTVIYIYAINIVLQEKKQSCHFQ